MIVTTGWALRQKHMSYYRVSDFQNDWDYFLYLHLNNQTRRLHLWGTLVGLSLLPWACYRFFVHWEILPMIIYTSFYYGVGFISHYICDGQVSETWRQLIKSYKYAVRLNLLGLRGKYKDEEERFKALYPQTLWVFQRELQGPK